MKNVLLDLTASTTVRDIKIRLLYHILNGDCFAQRCEESHDRSGCLCITSTFPSALSITSFIVSLLKDCPSSKLSTENLLLIVESTGDQSPYATKMNLRRLILASLDTFLLRCRRHSDPFGDLFMALKQNEDPYSNLS